MWKNMLRVLLQNNNHCLEKHDCYICLHKIQVREIVPNLSCLRTAEYCIQKKKNVWWSPNPRYKDAGGIKQTIHNPDRYGFNVCENLTCCARAEIIICEPMWLCLKSAHLVDPCTPHYVGTPFENSGTP